MGDQFSIKATDRRGPPRCPSNPAYPAGKHIQLASPGVPSCSTEIPYPADECLTWIIRCKRCGLAVAITAAGRPDDPRSLTVSCKARLQ